MEQNKQGCVDQERRVVRGRRSVVYSGHSGSRSKRLGVEATGQRYATDRVYYGLKYLFNICLLERISPT